MSETKQIVDERRTPLWGELIENFAPEPPPSKKGNSSRSRALANSARTLEHRTKQEGPDAE
jgi:hypothetical protein